MVYHTLVRGSKKWYNGTSVNEKKKRHFGKKRPSEKKTCSPSPIKKKERKKQQQFGLSQKVLVKNCN